MKARDRWATPTRKQPGVKTAQSIGFDTPSYVDDRRLGGHRPTCRVTEPAREPMASNGCDDPEDLSLGVSTRHRDRRGLLRQSS